MEGTCQKPQLFEHYCCLSTALTFSRKMTKAGFDLFACSSQAWLQSPPILPKCGGQDRTHPCRDGTHCRKGVTSQLTLSSQHACYYLFIYQRRPDLLAVGQPLGAWLEETHQPGDTPPFRPSTRPQTERTPNGPSEGLGWASLVVLSLIHISEPTRPY